MSKEELEPKQALELRLSFKSKIIELISWHKKSITDLEDLLLKVKAGIERAKKEAS
jgi:hypothetical protein